MSPGTQYAVRRTLCTSNAPASQSAPGCTAGRSSRKWMILQALPSMEPAGIEPATSCLQSLHRGVSLCSAVRHRQCFGALRRWACVTVGRLGRKLGARGPASWLSLDKRAARPRPQATRAQDDRFIACGPAGRRPMRSLRRHAPSLRAAAVVSTINVAAPRLKRTRPQGCRSARESGTTAASAAWVTDRKPGPSAGESRFGAIASGISASTPVGAHSLSRMSQTWDASSRYSC